MEMKMEGKRSEKIGDLIQKEVSEMLIKKLKDPRIGFVTITRVGVSEDCRTAKVYFSVAGTSKEKEQSIQGLQSATGYIRRQLGQRMKLRFIPEISFQFDPSIEYSIHIGEVIHQLQQEREKNGNAD